MNFQETKALICKYEIKPARSLGQNFLADDRVVQRLQEGIEIESDDFILEIGPGLGSLTRALASAGSVTAIEIDKHMVRVLEDTLEDHSNIEIVHADALKTELSELAGKASSIKVAANLPYYITTQLIEKMIVELVDSKLMLLMMQKEAAERLFAKPCNKLYGPVSILVALFGTADKYLRVPAAAYIPRPHVDSIVIRLRAFKSGVEDEVDDNKLKLNSMDLADRKSFHRFINTCFSQRRKVITNVLKNSEYRVLVDSNLITKIFDKYNLPHSTRAEEIPPDVFLELYMTASSVLL